MHYYEQEDFDFDMEEFLNEKLDINKNEIIEPSNPIHIVRVLIFLPPKYHLLFKMFIGDSCTVVKILSDFWEIFKYIDEYFDKR